MGHVYWDMTILSSPGRLEESTLLYQPVINLCNKNLNEWCYSHGKLYTGLLLQRPFTTTADLNMSLDSQLAEDWSHDVTKTMEDSICERDEF